MTFPGFTFCIDLLHYIKNEEVNPVQYSLHSVDSLLAFFSSEGGQMCLAAFTRLTCLISQPTADEKLTKYLKVSIGIQIPRKVSIGGEKKGYNITTDQKSPDGKDIHTPMYYKKKIKQKGIHSL